jgi:hypothetical protein
MEKMEYTTKMLSTVAICMMGTYCMWLTNGKTGIGWAILGVLFVWES